MPVELQVRAPPGWAEVAGSTLASLKSAVAQEICFAKRCRRNRNEKAECRWDYINQMFASHHTLVRLAQERKHVRGNARGNTSL